MSSLSVPRSKGRFAIVLLVAATILTFGYYAKLSFDAAHMAKDVIENVQKRTKTDTKTREVHGNSDENTDLHEVYEIYAEDSWGVRRTLKFGISGQEDFKTKDGNPRPEYQVPFYQAKDDYIDLKVWYEILYREIKGRKAAKEIEKRLVNEYYSVHREMPLEQKRPIPTSRLNN